ncbi:Maf family protein [Alkaliphilus peptidifermentans]|uniref:dTTP/UTP pyrophosphatase n=1 Tax=Alkaliphilus peptidifermentans DSM 18978 TaxID=1120976 RepID=A0A1G5DN21_9FIRM|nr:Maf family protein [Alkaliphilus peptidifermentans]SCY15977.1 septum formation protein [Alkaliphilus peptidifermentans DSM 18978]
MKKIILASNSPRRKELLLNLGLEFQVVVSNFDESLINCANPIELAEKIAYQKALSVRRNVLDDAIIIAADTIVFHDKLMGKPISEKDAYNMLRELSGKCHKVITAFSLLCSSSNIEIVEHEITKVYFKELSDEEIWSYISTGEFMDKAGAYGIQGKAALFVSRIEGDYFNVVGLPLYKLNQAMNKNFNFSLLK